MRTVKFILAFAIMGLVLAPASALAQEESYERYIELLRSDIQTQKVALFTEALQLSDEAGAKFWPIFREFENEQAVIGDRYVALIRDFAASYESMTDEKAKQLADASIKIEEDRVKLRKKYFGRFEKEIGARTAARWLQLERTVSNLILLQVQTELPLIP